MRTLAVQDDTELGGPWSVLVRQKRDHVQLDHLLHQLTEGPRDEQDAVLQSIARLVFPHAFAEEAVLWPELRRRLPDGHELTLTVEQEHQEINELWSRLERDTADGNRDELLARLVTVLRQDVRDEEDALLPRLQEAVGPRRLRQLGVAWELVRRTAPTRPHPLVSRRPPGTVLSALPLSVVDRTRDLLDSTARRSPARVRRVLASTSRSLAGVTDRLDRLRPLRTGEDPSTHV